MMAEAQKIQSGELEFPKLLDGELTDKMTPIGKKMKFKLLPKEMPENSVRFEKLTNNFLY
jgi:hypothetical protein